MKTRKSLVSNSSTTSFCIYGIHLDKDLIEEQESLFDIILKFKQSFSTTFNIEISKKLSYYDGFKKKAPQHSSFCDEKICFYQTLLKESLTVNDLKEKYKNNAGELRDFFCELIGNFEMSVNTCFDSGISWIGRPYTTIKDHETGKQFKESVESILSKLFNECKFGVYEESWRDG